MYVLRTIYCSTFIFSYRENTIRPLRFPATACFVLFLRFKKKGAGGGGGGGGHAEKKGKHALPDTGRGGQELYFSVVPYSFSASTLLPENWFHVEKSHIIKVYVLYLDLLFVTTV